MAADGTLLAAVHGPTISHQAVGLEAGVDRLAALVGRGARTGRPGPGSRRRPIADLGVYGLAGADYPEDVRRLRRAIEGRELTRTTVVLNDTFAALRAGTIRPWGVVLICGHGINAAAIAPDGRTARFAASASSPATGAAATRSARRRSGRGGAGARRPRPEDRRSRAPCRPTSGCIAGRCD